MLALWDKRTVVLFPFGLSGFSKFSAANRVTSVVRGGINYITKIFLKKEEGGIKETNVTVGVRWRHDPNSILTKGGAVKRWSCFLTFGMEIRLIKPHGLMVRI